VVANGSANNLPEGVPATLTLKDNVRVIGDAQTTGTTEVASTVKIEKGELKRTEEKAELPRIRIEDYDPGDNKEGVQKHFGANAIPPSGPLYGFHKFKPNPGSGSLKGTVTFTEDVDLQGALIYVEGDVVLEKPLKGTGALVATGKVTLKGGANMKADSLAAILAQEDLTITGGARDSNGVTSKFTGLLYTEGNLSLTNTRVVGSALAAGDGAVGQGSTMTLMDSEVLASPEGTDVAIAIQNFADPTGPSMTVLDSSEDSIVEPVASELIVDGKVIRDRDSIASLVKIRYNGVTYDNPEALPPDAPENLRTDFNRAVTRLMSFAEDLWDQNEEKPVEIVTFDLNEFLNVSDKLRSSRTFYIEG
jgi:hypothetical protein